MLRIPLGGHSTPEQAFHADGPLVGREVWERLAVPPSDGGPPAHSPRLDGASLPAHSLTIFVPLVDYDAGDGVEPTSFLPGSHQQPTAAALEAEALEAGSSGGAGVPAPLDAAAGDAILFDLRTHHAGGANASGERRSFMYLVYAVPWYDAELQRRLLEETGVVEREAVPPAKLEPL